MAPPFALKAAKLRYPKLQAELTANGSETEVDPAHYVIISSFVGRFLEDSVWERVIDPDGPFIDEEGIRHDFKLREKSGKTRRNITALTYSLVQELRSNYGILLDQLEKRWNLGDDLYSRLEDTKSLGPHSGNFFWLKLLGAVQRPITDDDRKSLFDALRDLRLYEDTHEQASGSTTSTLVKVPEKNFTYKPLARVTKPIRLVVLLPAKEQSAPLRCLLCNESLSNQPDYEALSYTWGDSSKTKPIEIDGKTFHATESLVSALRHLRYKENRKVRVLWIDALCINQQDDEEKGQQISQMVSVYGQARQTIIWLGPESTSSKQAINFLYELTSTLSDELKDVIPSATLGGRGSNLHPYYNTDWDALLQLLLRPWWQRLWILQELAVSNEVVFHCGNLTFSWHLLGYLDQVAEQLISMDLYSPRRKNPFGHTHHSTLKLILQVLKMGKLRADFIRYKDADEVMLTVPRLLSSSFGRLASDPRDFVYGILGMASEEERASPYLKPDYSLLPQTVYIRAAKYVLNQYRNLDILSLTGSYFEWKDDQSSHGGKWVRQAVLGLPSWVPEWCLHSPDHTRILRDGIFDSIPPPNAEELYTAGPKSPCPFKILDYPPSLSVVGIKVDIIKAIVPPPRTGRWDVTDRPFKSTIGHLKGKPYYGDQTIEEAYWRTLFTDCWGPFAQSAQDARPGVPYIQLGAEIPGVSAIPPTCPEQEEKLVSQYHRVSPRTLHDRSFFVSEEGFIGLGPADVEVGDVIVVLMGGRVPFILRGAWGAYLLVGESYVHGIMYGEFSEESNSGRRKMEVFTLV